nr:hypothetical protein [Tanacetum cinerariifolium]
MVVQSQLGEGSAILTDPQHIHTLLQPSSSQPQKTKKPRKAKRKDTQVTHLIGPTESVIDKVVYKELDDSFVRTTTTASSLKAKQDSGGGPRCQDTIGDTIAKSRSERVSKLSNDSLLVRGNTFQSDEDNLKIYELELCKTLQLRVLYLEQTKTTQANEIDSLKRRVKKLEKKQRSRTHKLKRLYKVGLTARVKSSDDEQSLGKDASKQRRISDIKADEGITLVSTHDDVEMFDVDKDLHELKYTKPKAKAKGIVFHKLEESIKATISKPKPQDNGKAIMIKEPLKLKKKDKIQLDEETALKTELVEESSNKAEAEVMEGSSKRACTELKQESLKRVGTKMEQESSKKQKIDDDKETAEPK